MHIGCAGVIGLLWTSSASLTHSSGGYVCTFGVMFCVLRLCYAQSHSDDSHACSARVLAQACPTRLYIHL